MTIWHLDVDRVRIIGAGAQGMDVVALRTLVEHAVQSALATAPLPKGRAARAAVEVHVPTLSSGTAIANAVARGVTQAVGDGGRAHG
jgi:hypothetical protein